MPEAIPAGASNRLDTDRRTFLKVLGVAGAGVAGAAAFAARPGAAWATTDAISLGNRMNQLAGSIDWHDKCQLAQFYAEYAARGSKSGIQTYPTATAAYNASHIESKDPSTAPAGSFSYWVYTGLNNAGHDALNIGNGYCINTSSHTSFATVYDFGQGLRITPLTGYENPYLGWSYTNGVNPQIDLAPWSPGGGGGGDWAWNAPDSATQKRIQQALFNRGRYSGPIDGVWGTNSIKGIQTTCQNVGYTGPVDGVPGKNTCHYVQVYAQKYGSYAGPVDDVLGPNSWNGFALGLERP